MPGRLLPFARYNSSSSSAERRDSTPVEQEADKKASNKSSTRASKTMDHFKRHSMAVVGSKAHSKSSPSEKDHHHHHHLKSLGKQRQASASPARTPAPTNNLSIVFESPPNIFYGPASSSTGALFSGRLKLSIIQPDITLGSFTMVLVARVSTKRPVVKDCPECTCTRTELHKWNFISEAKHLLAGTHEFPFSYLLPGHLPITTHGAICDLEYALEARATGNQAGDEPIELQQPLPVYRAMQPAQDKDSLRLFPPTNLTARITMPPIIHPIGDFNVMLRLDGIISAPQGPTQSRWRLRKMLWKLEETEKMISPACSKHAAKLGGEGKGVKHENVRVIGQEELKEGWKTDFSAASIEMEFKARPLGVNRPLCDVESPNGLAISHQLVLELVVAEEVHPVKFPDRVSLTGAARVLRMTLPLRLLERVGMGISWDEEQPPMYEDVPASPPMYAQGTRRDTNATVLDYTGPPLTPPPAEEALPLVMDSEVERLHIGDPSQAVPGESSAAGSSRAARSGTARLSADDFE